MISTADDRMLAQAQPLPQSLRFGAARETDLEARFRALETGCAPIADEEVWTYLVARAYACLPDGPTRLAAVLLRGVPPTPTPSIWLETLAYPAREQERNSHIDLALGAITWRSETKGGIHFAPCADGGVSWVAFVEAKVYSDIDCKRENDPLRNQWLRTIETALAFCTLETGRLKERGAAPDVVHAVLLTPRRFHDRPRTRFYGYKFHEYKNDPQAILDDLELASGNKRSHYPEDFAGCLERLRLHWVTYEEVLLGLPDAPFKSELIALARREGSIFRI